MPANYKSNLLRYPIDIGNTDRAHYMIIHVNVQEKTAYQSNFATGDEPVVQRNRTGLRNQTGALNIGGGAKLLVDNVKKLTDKTSIFVDSAVNAVNSITGGSLNEAAKNVTGAIPDALKGVASGAGAAASEAIGSLDNATFLRRIKRTTDSIALYMPGTMAFTHQQQYNSLALGGETASFLTAGGSILNDFATNKINDEQLGKNLTPFVLQKVLGSDIARGFLGEKSADAIFAGAIGGVQNPQLELIYGSPNFRTFRFEFMFYPTSEAEALQVQQIIDRLKFHQAPEIMTGTAGYFLVPPSEFDIEFYYNGQINPNIPKISTCVLTTIDMDYAPKGWQAYETGSNEPELGGTGMPFGIRLTLEFQETEIMTKYNFQGDRRTIAELKPGETLKK